MHDSVRKMQLDLIWRCIINTKDILLAVLLLPFYAIFSVSAMIVYSAESLLGIRGKAITQKYRTGILSAISLFNYHNQ